MKGLPELSSEKREKLIASIEKRLSSPQLLFFSCLPYGILAGILFGLSFFWFSGGEWQIGLEAGIPFGFAFVLLVPIIAEYVLPQRLAALKSGQTGKFTFDLTGVFRSKRILGCFALALILSTCLELSLFQIIGGKAHHNAPLVVLADSMKEKFKDPINKSIIFLCSAAVKLNPSWAAAYSTRADIYEEMGQFKQATESYTSAISLNPKSVYDYAWRGQCYLELKDYQKALADCNCAVNIDNQSFIAHCHRGEAYGHMKIYDKAVDDFTKTITIDPKHGCYLARAYTYGQLGQYQNALNDCNTVIGLNPKSADAFSDRGNIYLKMGQSERAIIDYTEAISLSPKDGDYYHQRAMAYEKLGLMELSAKDKAIAAQLGYRAEES